MMTMGRGELKAYLFSVIDSLDDASYAGFCELFLMACGVIDREGNLTEAYASSPYWAVEDGKLAPSREVDRLAEAMGGEKS